MAVSKPQKILTGDNQIDRLQDNIILAFNSISSPFIGGILLTGQPIANTDTVIQHKLNRTPQVWVITDQNTNTTVKRTAWDDNTITLVAGSACTISLWVN